MRVVRQVRRDRHRCRLPGWWARRKLDLDYGSIVECECWRRYQWGPEDGWVPMLNPDPPSPAIVLSQEVMP